jgi:hypothetical protein
MKGVSSRATVARHVLLSNKVMGSDNTFYDSIEAFEMSQSMWNVLEPLYVQFTKGWWFWPISIGWMIYSAIEWVVLFLFGLITAWGKRPVQPIIMLLLISLAFSVHYKCNNLAESWLSAFSDSFHVATLAGYGLVAGPSSRFVYGAHLVISIILYTVFFAVIVSRTNRVR